MRESSSSSAKSESVMLLLGGAKGADRWGVAREVSPRARVVKMSRRPILNECSFTYSKGVRGEGEGREDCSGGWSGIYNTKYSAT